MIVQTKFDKKQRPLFLGQQETLQHLFFGFSFSQAIWRPLIRKLGCQQHIFSLNDVLTWVAKGGMGPALRRQLCRTLLAAAMYHVRRRRNAIIFEGSSRSCCSTSVHSTVCLQKFSSCQAFNRLIRAVDCLGPAT